MKSSLESRHVMVRCDASATIGTGHLSRCLSLSRLLQSKGCRVVIFCRDHNDSVHLDLLRDEFECVSLPKRSWLDEPDENQSRSLYAQWLACDPSDDVLDCRDACQRLGDFDPEIVVVDHYGLDEEWERAISSLFSPMKLLAIDDLANRPHCADYLVDSSVVNGWSDHRYDSLVNADCQVLLGPRYAFLSADYAAVKRVVRPRDSVNRVFVFFGGVDQLNYCALALRSLNHPRLVDLQVDVVLGSASPHLDEIRRLVDARENASLHVGLPSLAELLAKADLALGAAGVHSWERACLGLPAIAVAVAENQRGLVDVLAKSGVIKSLAPSPKEILIPDFANALIDFLDDPGKLMEMSVASSGLLDVFGLNRLALALIGIDDNLSLRPADVDDLGLYFWWANDPSVRSASLQSSEISFTEHSSWFMNRLSSENALLRVLIDSSGLPLGQIRFERCADTPSRALLSFSVDRLARGYGLAQHLLKLGLCELNQLWGENITIFAQVKSENAASAKSLLRSGFELIDEADRSVHCFRRLPKQ